LPLFAPATAIRTYQTTQQASHAFTIVHNLKNRETKTKQPTIAFKQGGSNFPYLEIARKCLDFN